MVNIWVQFALCTKKKKKKKKKKEWNPILKIQIPLFV